MTNEKLTQQILEYLEEHPEAGDTLEGIATWWVQCQQVSESVIAVRQALQQLESDGIVTERKTPSGKTLYFLRDDR